MNHSAKASSVLNTITHSDVIAQLDHVDFPLEKDEASILSSIRFAEQLFPGKVVLLCHLKHDTSPYVSSNCASVFGFSVKELQAFSPEEFFARIHPEDLPAVINGYHKIKAGVEQWQLHLFRFITNYRFLHKQGTYVHVIDEKFTLVTTNNRYLFFILFEASTDSFAEVNLSILKVQPSGVEKIETHFLSPDRGAITPREMEILKFLDNAKSNLEIASTLGISVSTVKKHRQSLFKKANVKNSISLVAFAKARNFL